MSLILKSLTTKSRLLSSLPYQALHCNKCGLHQTKLSETFLSALTHRTAWSRGFHASFNLASKILFTNTHEWIKVDGDIGTIGITDFAQKELDEIVFCELPDVSQTFEKGDIFASVDSVKAVSELYMPVSGEIVTINEEIVEDPKLINDSPMDDGWLVTVKLAESSDDELSSLMNEAEYNQFKDSESHD